MMIEMRPEHTNTTKTSSRPHIWPCPLYAIPNYKPNTTPATSTKHASSRSQRAATDKLAATSFPRRPRRRWRQPDDEASSTQCPCAGGNISGGDCRQAQRRQVYTAQLAGQVIVTSIASTTRSRKESTVGFCLGRLGGRRLLLASQVFCFSDSMGGNKDPSVFEQVRRLAPAVFSQGGRGGRISLRVG